MTSKLKCPFCNSLLETRNGVMFGCDRCERVGTEKLWQALTQAKQDLETAKADIEDYKKYKALWEQIRNNTILELERKLEIARRALEDIASGQIIEHSVFGHECDNKIAIARNALEQIEHKE